MQIAPAGKVVVLRLRFRTGRYFVHVRVFFVIDSGVSPEIFLPPIGLLVSLLIDYARGLYTLIKTFARRAAQG